MRNQQMEKRKSLTKQIKTTRDRPVQKGSRLHDLMLLVAWRIVQQSNQLTDPPQPPASHHEPQAT